MQTPERLQVRQQPTFAASPFQRRFRRTFKVAPRSTRKRTRRRTCQRQIYEWI